MAKRKRKTELQDAFDAVTGFAKTVDTVFERLTGKTVAAWFKEFQQSPRELPPGEQAAAPQPAMPLADAYAILGLPQTASLEEVKKNYKGLAAVFHPDKGGYKEAMVLLNNAYEQIMKGGK